MLFLYSWLWTTCNLYLDVLSIALQMFGQWEQHQFVYFISIEFNEMIIIYKH